MELEKVVFNIIVHAGNAKGYCFQALALAKKREFDDVEGLMKKAKEELLEAHSTQTKMIENEANGIKQEMTLLMVHAQDHLMNASLAMDLVVELIDLYKDKYSNN